MKQGGPTWHQHDADEVVGQLETNLTDGLSPDEARFRIERYGRNELTARRGRHPLVKFLLQFHQPFLHPPRRDAGHAAASVEKWVRRRTRHGDDD